MASLTQPAVTANETQRRINNGDLNTLGELFARHEQRLLEIIRLRMDRRLASRIDPEDVLQEVFVDAASRVQHYHEQHSGSFFIWLRLITDQTMANLYRRHLETKKRDVRRDVSINTGGTFETESQPVSIQLVSRSSSPSNVFSRQESVNEIERIVAGLKPIDREAIALRHYELLDNKEVAERLGLSEKAASIRYIRAIRRLKEAIDSANEAKRTATGTHNDVHPFCGNTKSFAPSRN